MHSGCTKLRSNNAGECSYYSERVGIHRKVLAYICIVCIVSHCRSNIAIYISSDCSAAVAGGGGGDSEESI